MAVPAMNRLKRWLLGIPKEDPRYLWAIHDGKRYDFDKPLTTWQAVAEIARQEREKQN